MQGVSSTWCKVWRLQNQEAAEPKKAWGGKKAKNYLLEILISIIKSFRMLVPCGHFHNISRTQVQSWVCPQNQQWLNESWRKCSKRDFRPSVVRIYMTNSIPGITHIQQGNKDLLCDLPIQLNQCKCRMKLITTRNWNEYASISQETEHGNVSST